MASAEAKEVRHDADTTIRTQVANSRQRVEKAKQAVMSAIAEGRQKMDELCEDIERRTISGQMIAVVDPMRELDKIGKPRNPPPLPKGGGHGK